MLRNWNCAFWMQINKFSTFVEKMQKIEFFYFHRIDSKFELWILQYNPSILLKYLARRCAPSTPIFELILSWWQKYQKSIFFLEFWNFERKKFIVWRASARQNISVRARIILNYYLLKYKHFISKIKKLEKIAKKSIFDNFHFLLKNSIFSATTFCFFHLSHISCTTNVVPI